jgi:hypothetical protein
MLSVAKIMAAETKVAFYKMVLSTYEKQLRDVQGLIENQKKEIEVAESELRFLKEQNQVCILPECSDATRNIGR